MYGNVCQFVVVVKGLCVELLEDAVSAAEPRLHWSRRTLPGGAAVVSFSPCFSYPPPHTPLPVLSLPHYYYRLCVSVCIVWVIVEESWRGLLCVLLKNCASSVDVTLSYDVYCTIASLLWLGGWLV